VLGWLNRLDNLPSNVRDHELNEIERKIQAEDLTDAERAAVKMLVDLYREESRGVRSDERHTTDLNASEQVPTPDADPLPAQTTTRVDSEYQAVHDALMDLLQRQVITQVQSLVLQAAGADEIRRLLGMPVPDFSRRQYGINLDRARADYMRQRAVYNRRFQKSKGFKPLPRLKRTAYKRALEAAKAAIKDDRVNPKPMPPESERREQWIVNERGEIAPHIGPNS